MWGRTGFGYVGFDIQHETATLILIGLNFGSVFCHFLYDRAVFRFSHPATRAASGKLLFFKGAW
jgi:hypothetical protein